MTTACDPRASYKDLIHFRSYVPAPEIESDR